MKRGNIFTWSIVLSLYLVLCTLYSFSQKPPEQPKQLTRILFLFDDSQSMRVKWQSNTKFEIAKKLLSEMVDSLQRIDNLELALRVYGHTKRFPPQDCDDTRLEVPFGRMNSFQIKKKLKEIQPSGTTPIAASLQECEKDFPDDPSRNIIILITDGIEECNGDPCAVSYALQKKGIVLKPFVIGLGITKDFAKSFDCVGTYYDAAEESSFRTVLSVVISQALNNTSMQINLLDAFGKPTETNVGMTFYDQFSGVIRYNFVHTMNAKGYPDTLKVDPLSKYNIVVHTLPPVKKDSVKVTPGKHIIVGIDAAQGDLYLKLDATTEYKNLQTIVRKHDEMKTLHVQSFNTKERYLVGKYDLEILTLPEMLVDNVDISQSKTTTIEIPKPGIVTLLSNNPGYGSIYVEENNKLRWIYSMDENQTKESVVLQPGKYRVIFRSKNSRESIYTVDKIFRVASGSSISVNVF
ncbi:MAG: VWA domain-containing protein [Bacteroidia bacterium]